LNDCVLKAERISIGYRYSKRNRLVVAQDLSFRLNAGELICLVGPNGVGKSTLLRSLAGLQVLFEGQIWIQDRLMQKIPPRELARMIGVVLTSQVNVGAMRAFEVVALGRHPYTGWSGKMNSSDEIAVGDALRMVDALPLSQRTFSELSDGERQKILIARALAQEPNIMLLDEPTAFLDLPRRVMLMQMLRGLAHDWGKAILVSTHDLDLALQSADVIWMMGNDGSIRSGAPEDLVLNGQFEHVFAQQGVQFDNRSGNFVVTTPSEMQVSVQGDGLALFWTMHALKRAGFEIVAQRELAEKHVEIIQEGEMLAWRLHSEGITIDHNSIYALILSLNN
jgi:iron complex transport system ATP-binding protein